MSHSLHIKQFLKKKKETRVKSEGRKLYHVRLSRYELVNDATHHLKNSARLHLINEQNKEKCGTTRWIIIQNIVNQSSTSRQNLQCSKLRIALLHGNHFH
jgi:hypothetical protein